MEEEIQSLCRLVDPIKDLQIDPSVKPLVSLMEERNAYVFESLDKELILEEKSLEMSPRSAEEDASGKTLLGLAGHRIRDGMYYSAKK